MLAEILFWSSAALLAYGYVGFPLLVALVGRILDRGVRRERITPRVSLLIAAYNEEDGIERRIENALASRYPEDRLEIIVASDGSTDRTEEIVAGYEGERVRLLSLPRRGKAHALNEAARRSRGEILVFSDANTLFEPQALAALVRSFADPEVGGVAGHTGYEVQDDGESAGRGEALYWKYDTWLKKLETRTGSVISAHGGMYAIRRELFQPLGDPAVTDDFAISTAVVAQGRRLVFEPAARGYESPVHDSAREFSRRVRLMTRGLRGALVLRRDLLDFRRYGFYSVSMFSHKVLRRGLPLLLPVLFLASVALSSQGTFYLTAAAAQAGFYLLALAGWALRGRRVGRWKLFYVPFFFCLANLASLVAFWGLLRGRRIERWNPQRHDSDDHGAGPPDADELGEPERSPATAGSGATWATPQHAGDGEKAHASQTSPAPTVGWKLPPPAWSVDLPIWETESPDEARELLGEVEGALHQKRLQYCVLRRPGAPGVRAGRPRGIQLLVHPDDAPEVEREFLGAGFLLFPPNAPGIRSHLLGRPGRDGRWKQIDVRTGLRYGRRTGAFRTAEAGSGLLERRVRRGGVWRPSPDDELLDLLLHGLLDRARISGALAERLGRLLHELRRCPPLAGRAAERTQFELAPALTWERVVGDVEEERWGALAARRHALALHLARRQPGGTLARSVGGSRALLARPPFALIANRGRIAALLAPDGGGKSTVARGLARNAPTPARVVYGGYPHPRPYLPASVQRLGSFWWRALKIRWLRTVGYLVIMDRYLFDGWVSEKGLDPGRRSWRRRILEWPFPHPDLVVVLDAPGAELHRRSGEHTPAALEERRRAYLSLQERIPGVVVVDAVRPEEDVLEAVTGFLWPDDPHGGTRQRWTG